MKTPTQSAFFFPVHIEYWNCNKSCLAPGMPDVLICLGSGGGILCCGVDWWNCWEGFGDGIGKGFTCVVVVKNGLLGAENIRGRRSWLWLRWWLWLCVRLRSWWSVEWWWCLESAALGYVKPGLTTPRFGMMTGLRLKLGWWPWLCERVRTRRVFSCIERLRMESIALGSVKPELWTWLFERARWRFGWIERGFGTPALTPGLWPWLYVRLRSWRRIDCGEWLFPEFNRLGSMKPGLAGPELAPPWLLLNPGLWPWLWPWLCVRLRAWPCVDWCWFIRFGSRKPGLVGAGSGKPWLTEWGKGCEGSRRGKRSTLFLGKIHENSDVKHLTKAYILLAIARSAPVARTWSGTSVRSISSGDKGRDKTRLPNSLAITMISLIRSENPFLNLPNTYRWVQHDSQIQRHNRFRHPWGPRVMYAHWSTGGVKRRWGWTKTIFVSASIRHLDFGLPCRSPIHKARISDRHFQQDQKHTPRVRKFIIHRRGLSTMFLVPTHDSLCLP